MDICMWFRRLHIYEYCHISKMTITFFIQCKYTVDLAFYCKNIETDTKSPTVDILSLSHNSIARKNKNLFKDYDYY